MENYGVWADLLATFRASPDGVKILWLLVPPGLVLGIVALSLRYFLRRYLRGASAGTLAYTIIRQDDCTVQIYSHIDGKNGDGKDEDNPVFLPLDPQDNGKALEYWQKSEWS